MKTLETLETHLRDREVAERAMHLWELAGYHHHRDLEYWLQAESELGAALPPALAEESASRPDREPAASEQFPEALAPAW